MSRGLGRIQQAIIELIETEPHGAWTTTQLCQHTYDDSVEKRHRVAVARALRRMTLPPLWWVRRADKQGAEYCLYNAGDEESTSRAVFFGDSYAWNYANFEQWKERCPHRIDKARKCVEEVLCYHNASPIEKLDIDIDRVRQQIALLHGVGTSGANEFVTQLARRAAELIERREALKAGT
jgi:hypothetical protein